ncbi:MAG: hypothetical protein Q8R39_01150 [bacterium]|nr:hypothetical protein [bacterium]MDZ4284220.1 hypothetical protein [Patescibacteria group bacterium]
MFKDYWEQKKHLIQLVGILTGVGALFLSITPPENVDARQALSNIQFVWLVVITFSCSVLFISFLNFSVDVEKHYGSKWAVNLKETLSLVIFLSLLYFLKNLWAYIIGLYSSSFWDFLQGIYVGIFITVGVIFFHFSHKLVAKINRTFHRTMLLLVSYVVFSSLAGFMSLFINNKGITFNFSTLLFFTGFVFVLLLAITFFDELIRWKKKVANEK